MRILRSLIVPTLGLIGLLPLASGCDYDDHHDHYDHERRAYPAGYRYDHDEYYHRDGDWDHDRWHDRDDWRRDHY